MAVRVQCRKSEGGFFPSEAERASLFEKYVDGGWYDAPSVVAKRSQEEHSHFFAMLPRIFAMLPDEYQGQWGNPDQMRAKSLIQTNWCNVQPWPCPDDRTAISTAALMRMVNPYSIVVRKGNVMHIYSARSMKVDDRGKKGGMTAKEFRAAKQALLELWANIIGCSVDDLVMMAGREPT